MSHVEQAIRDAILAGWVELGGKDKSWWEKPWGPQPGRSTPLQDVCREIAQGKDKNCPGTSWLLDPLFWQSLGKARGWAEEVEMQGARVIPFTKQGTWSEHWHRFIDHLAEGKDAESFFETLAGSTEEV